MKQLIPEVEERYGAARSILLPVVVSRHQVDMLRAAEGEAEERGWNFMLMLFAGAQLVTEVTPQSNGACRLPEFRLPSDILDLEVFEEEFKAKVEENYGLNISLSRYLLLVHCTFMATDPESAGDDNSTSSRTLHVFTARANTTDDLGETKQNTGKADVKLVKPTVLLDSLQAEWSDLKTQVNSGGKLGDLKAEYDKSWTFVRARVVATAFQRLFGWPLPEL